MLPLELFFDWNTLDAFVYKHIKKINSLNFEAKYSPIESRKYRSLNQAYKVFYIIWKANLINKQFTNE